jgi:hypothetical protein
MKANRLYSYFLSVGMIFLISSCQPTDKKTSTPSQKIKEKPFKNKEDVVIDQVMALPEIKQKNIEVEKNSKGKRHLLGYVVTLSTSKDPYYWVNVAEDNGDSYVTYYTFTVDNRDLHIEYYDPVQDSLISIEQWRKDSSN